LYAAGVYGLIARRRWGWMLIAAYLLYISLSEGLYALLGSFGYLNRPPIAPEILWAHVPYYLVLAGLIAFVEWSL
jgi:hypothetical protein